MSILRIFARRMVAKVFLVVGVAVGAALLIHARIESRREASALKMETRDSANQIANLVIGAVEHSMLEGDGLKVKALVASLKRHIPEASVHIYDQRGIEVFGAKPPAPSPRQIPAWVVATMTDRQRKVTPKGRVIRPIQNQPSCHGCHPKNEPLRGILELDIDEAAYRSDRDTVLPSVIRSGFVHIMTARRSRLLDDYFDTLVAGDGVVGAAVYDRDGEVSFGKPIDGVDGEAIKRLFVKGSAPSHTRLGSGSLSLVPLPMEERCVACHEDPIGSIRGVLGVALSGDGSKRSSLELEGAIDTSLRFIMLSALGRRIADFLDAAATTSAIRHLVLYDNAGRRYWTTRHTKPSPEIAAALELKSLSRFVGSGEGERIEVVRPLRNGKGCVRCHGSDSAVRGAVAVSLSTAGAARERERSMERRTKFTAITLIGILIILIGVIQFLVARRVNYIGDVADAVRQGDLGLQVPGAHPDGDEIARLGDRVNHMVRGLRAKMHLEKFVSRGAARAASSADLDGVSRAGEARDLTVLFSDIRGFTAYSEGVPPEAVVAMLNRILRAQAEVVTKFGGDIDKFIGDELMAVFDGEDAAERAVRCAVEMVDAVHQVRTESLSVGVGISCGEMIYGAVGHEERMDFTVIGDVVNTGARLCSAAQADQILVTEAVREAASAAPITFVQGEPLSVKGKREPLTVYQVVGLGHGQ